MRLGQTSVVVFASRIGSSALGFLATIYFARTLGSSVLGVYFLVLALVGWLTLGAKAGVTVALVKRLSERDEQTRYLLAGASILAATTLLVAALTFGVRGFVNRYLGAELYQAVILLLCARMVYTLMVSTVQGFHLVHLKGVLNVSQTLVRVGAQLVAVWAGLEVAGLVAGEVVGFALVGGGALLATLARVRSDLRLPERRHYRSIVGYAKYSWIQRLKGSTFSMMDKLVLGVFVSSGLIGIYSICWNIAAVMGIFSKSVGNAFFPAMSELSSDGDDEQVAERLRDTLAFAGLFSIPGLVGAAVVGEGVLNMYGGEFRQGYLVLILLVGSTVVHSYHRQMVNTMNAVDRPELSFRTNVLFVASNVALNFVLVFVVGWVGAAVATLVSVGLSAAYALWLLQGVIRVRIPWSEIARQIGASVIMGLSVYLSLGMFEGIGVNPVRAYVVVPAVMLGVVVYFVTLVVISDEFRRVVVRNVPNPVGQGNY